MPGIDRVTVGVIVNFPRPVFAAAAKNFTAAGAEAAAGTTMGYVTPSIGFVQWPPVPLHTTVGAALMLEAVFDRDCVPVVNAVDVIVRLQPAPEPLASCTVSPIE